MKGKPKPFLRNSEIDELCERLIYEYMGNDGAGKPVDIIGFTTGFLKLTILYANIAEEDMSKLGFLSDGRTPLLVSCKGQTVSHVFPEKTIVLDRFLKAEKERNRRFFTIAHEAFHYLNSLVNNVPQQAAFHNEFDLDCHYTREDFARMMSVQECQADRGAAALLMPKSLLLQTCMQFNDGKPIAVYGNSVFTAADRAVLFEIAEYLRVSFTALVIRMEHLKLFEKHDFSEYVSSELHLGNPEAYG